MGFNCIICGEREIWYFESNTPRVCCNCYNRQHGIPPPSCDPNAQIMACMGLNIGIPNLDISLALNPPMMIANHPEYWDFEFGRPKEEDDDNDFKD